jgi:prolycopene isomerase
MTKNYDAIVVGAGNGGMTGALTLAKAGKQVLLLEQHSITGGCGSSFVRGRFEFETGLHQLYGVGPDTNGDKPLNVGLFVKNFSTCAIAYAVFLTGAKPISR